MLPPLHELCALKSGDALGSHAHASRGRTASKQSAVVAPVKTPGSDARNPRAPRTFASRKDDHCLNGAVASHAANTPSTEVRGLRWRGGVDFAIASCGVDDQVADSQRTGTNGFGLPFPRKAASVEFHVWLRYGDLPVVAPLLSYTKTVWD